jgi:4-hydroxy-4-methyl-2-oxoglutarate aldolase
VWHDCPALSGVVRIVRLEPAAGAASPLPELLEFLADASGSVVFVDLGGRLDLQCWGTVLATAARRFGVLGAVVNGAVRDIDGLRTLGLPCYARGAYPGAMRGRLRLHSTDEAAQLDGQTVMAGSLAFVDESGAVFLPAERAANARARAAERAEAEQRVLDAFAAGADPRDVLGSGDDNRP